MNVPEPRISARSLAVLEMIAGGNTYEEILATFPELTYLDIFRAAQEALALAKNESGGSRPAYTMAEKRERHHRAYEKWTDAEDDLLRELVRSGETVARIAGSLRRNRGAIRSRLLKLGLVNELSIKERERFQRTVDGDAEEPADSERNQ